MGSNSRWDERELEILQLLWRHGPQKPAELQARLSHGMKNSALRWLLNELVERGRLRRKKEAKAYLYSAAIGRRSLLAALGQKLRDVLFAGSALAMIGELIEVQKLSPEDIDYLRMVAGKRAEPKKRRRRTKK